MYLLLAAFYFMAALVFLWLGFTRHLWLYLLAVLPYLGCAWLAVIVWRQGRSVPDA